MQGLLEQHVAYTGSTVAQAVLADFDNIVASKFYKVFPHEYAAALRKLEAEAAQQDLLAQYEGTDALAELKQVRPGAVDAADACGSCLIAERRPAGAVASQ